MSTNIETKWGIVYCRKNNYQATRRWESIVKCLNRQQIAFEHAISDGTSDVERHVRMFVSKGVRTIIIVGGDSALNDAVNCLMQEEKRVRDEVYLGVIPNGLMNDFAHFWGFQEGDVEQSVTWLKAQRVRKIDVGRIRYTNKHNEACHRYFLNCVNIGLVASMMNVKYWARHTFFGARPLSFLASFVVMLFHRLDYKMKLKINTDAIERKIMTLCVGNSTGYGQTPNAVPYNGLLDVSVVFPTETLQIFEGIYLFLRGKFLNHRRVKAYRTYEVRLDDCGRALISVDGRLLQTPKGSFTIKVEQEVINFLIPA